MNTKNLTLKLMTLILGAMFVACSKPPSVLPNIKVNKQCDKPIVAYKMGSIKSGEYNQLNIDENAIKTMLENTLSQSGCFVSTDVLGHNGEYLLEVVYGSINIKSNRGDWLQSTSQNAGIIELQMAFSNQNEFRVFSGKATIENSNNQYFTLGKEATLLPQEVRQTILNAINAATNEAITNFKTN
ncbi:MULTISPECIES: hypothetical protein [Helicobacter]|uniref:Lipoprotein n=1 Tax=Helicobacter ibis TaxID=2962633 RepID=A0ABT4VCV0_9HELI|nr:MULTISPECIES: hypothetical protein [Helicobacter]MDA3966695.1 hypothetical protein [Helicobacter sp. WB40]MDA3968537.1 hypothetical protein [Helicobacter ibis]